MSGYRLTGPAYKDLEEILTGMAEHAGWERSMRLEETLFRAFERIADMPGMGRRRPDLNRPDFLFYTAAPYLIAYQQTADMVMIHAIVHGARDLPHVIQQR